MTCSASSPQILGWFRMPLPIGRASSALKAEPDSGGIDVRAADVMTKEVLTVNADATVQLVAAILSERGISAVPVLDANNQVVGIVSEGDLLHRAEIGT